MTDGRGADRCIDAVGAEAHATGSFDALLDKTKASVFLATDRAHVLREAIGVAARAARSLCPGFISALLTRFLSGHS